MIDTATLDTLHQRLVRVLAPPARRYIPLRIEGVAVGFLSDERARRLAKFDDVFRVDTDEASLVPTLATEPDRSAALADVAKQLAAEGALTAWRNERYAVVPGHETAPWFYLERAAARYFGIHTWAAHLNGLVRDDAGCQLWFARRSPDKPIDPGLLDNLVGGGIAAGATADATLVKEAWEEAGIPPALASIAMAVGKIEIRRDQPDGLQWETIYAYDLWLPAAFTPANQDGEAVAHLRVDFAEAARLIGCAPGCDEVTADASLVVLDCLLRHGAIDPAGPHFGRLAALRHSEWVAG
jgi:8-oxo-dGTP pyrophosphatase MutT (NUDIX family)